MQVLLGPPTPTIQSPQLPEPDLEHDKAECLLVVVWLVWWFTAEGHHLVDNSSQLTVFLDLVEMANHSYLMEHVL